MDFIKVQKCNAVTLFLCRRGLLGIDRVINHLIKEWLNHIKNKQLPSLLQGIGPMNSIVIFCKYHIADYSGDFGETNETAFFFSVQSKELSIYSVCHTNNTREMVESFVVCNLVHRVLHHAPL